MQEDFHYYAAYAAAWLAGYTHEESLVIAYCNQMTDCLSKPFLARIGGPRSAATTQLQLELMDAMTDPEGLRDITRIWASFHFLPYDLQAEVKKGGRKYRDKYRLICCPNGKLLPDTVNLAKGKSLEAAGLAMHVLSDTWAHAYFAGTPSLVINNTDFNFFELIPAEDGFREQRVTWRHNVKAPDDLGGSRYTNTILQTRENSIMNLGHGRAGHLPDYSFARYRYLPSWGDYAELTKDNPSDYFRAFSQMIYALKYLKGQYPVFEADVYDTVSVLPYEERIRQILEKRQLDGSADWKAFSGELSGREIPDFSIETYQAEYLTAPAAQKDETLLGRFILAAIAQKSMVTGKIWESGNKLAGKSIRLKIRGSERVEDFLKTMEKRG